MPRPRVHLAISAGLAGGAYALARDWRATVAIFGAGFFVDADHLVDYAVFQATGERYGIVPLHGWEIAGLLWGIATVTRWRPFALFGALSYTVHLALDQLFNQPVQPLGYFWTYRLAHRFGRTGFDTKAGRVHDWVEQPVTSWF